jgi:hypothetical protein
METEGSVHDAIDDLHEKVRDIVDTLRPEHPEDDETETLPVSTCLIYIKVRVSSTLRLHG